VDNVTLVTVIDCRKYLGYYFCGIYFAEVLLLRNFVEQLSAIAEPVLKRKPMNKQYKKHFIKPLTLSLESTFSDLEKIRTASRYSGGPSA